MSVLESLRTRWESCCSPGSILKRRSLAMLRASVPRPQYLCLLAKACIEMGRLDDGLSALTEVLAAADEHENRVHEAEAYRLKGELLVRQNDSNLAVARSCFERAIDIA